LIDHPTPSAGFQTGRIADFQSARRRSTIDQFFTQSTCPKSGPPRANFSPPTLQIASIDFKTLQKPNPTIRFAPTSTIGRIHPIRPIPTTIMPQPPKNARSSETPTKNN
jgi:hypothetical protein